MFYCSSKKGFIGAKIAFSLTEKEMKNFIFIILNI